MSKILNWDRNFEDGLKISSWVFPTCPECLWNSFNKRRTQRSSLSLTWHDLAVTFSRFYILKDFLFVLKISLLYFICFGIRYFLIYQESGNQPETSRQGANNRRDRHRSVCLKLTIFLWMQVYSFASKSAEFFGWMNTEKEKTISKTSDFIESGNIVCVRMLMNVFVYFKPFSTMRNLQSIQPDSKVNQTGISAKISRFL